MAESQAELWIFAYGSLMWRPDFRFAESLRAVVTGYRRALCIRSHVYRGTAERPGLVFGLDRGASCTGVAYRIPAEDVEATLDAVRVRELVLSVYREVVVPAELADGRNVQAIAYVADPGHPQYAGPLPERDLVAIVRRAEGDAGRNLDYVLNTQAHLAALGVHDPELFSLCRALDAEAA